MKRVNETQGDIIKEWQLNNQKQVTPDSAESKLVIVVLRVFSSLCSFYHLWSHLKDNSIISGLKEGMAKHFVAQEEKAAPVPQEDRFKAEGAEKYQRRDIGPANWIDKSSNADVVRNMIAKMGFKEGKGLGKAQNGMIGPIKFSENFGRLGLGNDWLAPYSAESQQPVQENAEEEEGNNLKEVEYMVCQVQKQLVICARINFHQNQDWPYFISIEEHNLEEDLKIGNRILLREFQWIEKFRHLANDGEVRNGRLLWLNEDTGLLPRQAVARKWELTEQEDLEEQEGKIAIVKKKGLWDQPGETKYIVVEARPHTRLRSRLIQRQCFGFDLYFAWSGDRCIVGLATLPAGTLWNSWFILPASSPYRRHSSTLNFDTKMVVAMKDFPNNQQ